MKLEELFVDCLIAVSGTRLISMNESDGIEGMKVMPLQDAG